MWGEKSGDNDYCVKNKPAPKHAALQQSTPAHMCVTQTVGRLQEESNVK